MLGKQSMGTGDYNFAPEFDAQDQFLHDLFVQVAQNKYLVIRLKALSLKFVHYQFKMLFISFLAFGLSTGIWLLPIYSERMTEAAFSITRLFTPYQSIAIIIGLFIIYRCVEEFLAARENIYVLRQLTKQQEAAIEEAETILNSAGKEQSDA